MKVLVHRRGNTSSCPYKSTAVDETAAATESSVEPSSSWDQASESNDSEC